MFDAQMLIRGSSDVVVRSPWFPRGGDKLIVTAEQVANGGGTLTVRLLTKNSEETTDGDEADDTKSITLSGADTRESEEWTSGIEELVRYQFTLTGSSGQWVLFRMLSPVWFDAVAG